MKKTNKSVLDVLVVSTTHTKILIQKITYLLIIFSLVFSSLSMPVSTVTAKSEDPEPKPVEKTNSYKAPIFNHPKAIIGERPVEKQDDELPAQPIYFIQNEGQIDSSVNFQVYGENATLNFVADGVWLTVVKPEIYNVISEDAPVTNEDPEISPTPMPGHFGSSDNTEQGNDGVNIHAKFEGANPAPVIEGFNPIDTKISFFKGNDSSKWKSNLPVWGGIRYVEIYPGYDLEVTSENGQLVQQLVKKQITSLKQFSFSSVISPLFGKLQELNLSYEGAQPVNELNNQTVLSTEIGDITFPIANLSSNAAQTSALQFSANAANSEGSKEELPFAGAIINFSTFISSGSGSDIVVDKSTNETYTIAYSYDTNNPIASGGFQTHSHGGWEFLIFKLSSDGSTLEYATYLGGSSDDWGWGIDIGPDKSAYITGWTQSSDFPVTAKSYDTSINASQTPFIAKINPDGTQLVYSTFLGQGQSFNIKVDSQGFAYVTGQTKNYSFPTTAGAFMRYSGGQMDGFVTKINQNGNGLVYSTYIGGADDDCEAGGNHKESSIDVNDLGEVTLAGITRSSNFPTTPNAYDRTFGGLSDTFVLRLNSSGSNLIYSTFMGGPGGDAQYSMSMAVAADGSTIVAGQTDNNSFPTTDGAYQHTNQGGIDSYIYKLSPDGSHLIYSTLLGGNENDIIYDLALTSSGQPVVFGETSSTNFPVTSFAVKDRETCSTTNCIDAFVTSLKPDGTWLEYSTLFGGNNWDWANGIDVASDDSIYITGGTNSGDFPISSNAFRKNNPGNSIYVASLTALPVIDGYSTVSYGSKDCTDACIVTYKGDIKPVGDPINSQSGAFNFPTTDISFNTSAGTIAFTRDYASLIAAKSNSNLGYGWTHSLDSHLVFPGDPEGQVGRVSVKINSANLYKFQIQSDGTYKATRGVLAFLTKISSSPDSYELITPAQEKLIFNETGRIVTWKNATGNNISYLYDGSNRLQQVSADGGQKYIQVNYNDQNQINSVNDHAGRSVSFQYNVAGDLDSITDVNGKAWIFNYDESHRLLAVTNPLNQIVVRNEYDEVGRVVRQFDGNNNLVVDLSYAVDGTTTITDALGHIQVVHNNEINAVEGEAAADGGTTGKKYDSNFRPISITDPLNHTTDLQWSSDGVNLTQMTDAAGNQTNLTYDSYNNITSVVDTRGNLTQNFYEDPNHPTLLTKSTDSSDKTRLYSYTGDGRLETETDPSGNVTRFTYDQLGQRTGMSIESIPDTNGSSRIISYQYSYDSLGRLVDTTEANYVGGGNPQTHVTHNEYDLAGHLTRIVRNYSPDHAQNEAYEISSGTQDFYNITTIYLYDDAGRQVSVTDTLNHTTQYEYDAAGHVTKTIDPLGNETTSTYNEAGQLISTSDALGHSTSYTYDSNGRQLTVTDAIGHTTSTAYNLDGTVASRTDARGKTSTYTYDKLKRVIAVTDPMGNTTHTSYDTAGNIASTTDAAGYVITKEYDPLNRLIKENYPQIGSGGSTASMEYFYDSNGNVIQSLDRNGNRTTNYYDGFNRLVKVEDSSGHPTIYEYDANGNRTAVVDSQNKRTEYTYDSQGRVVVTKDPSGYLTSKLYDVLGNETSAYNANGKATSYTLDELGRVIQENLPGGGVARYTYDALGNRQTSTDPNGNTTTYRYDELNRVIEVINASGKSTRTDYDENGNVIASTNAKGETTSYAYDDLNRQIRVTDPIGISTSYSYDAKGNRTSVTDGRGITTRFEYDSLSRLVAVIENYQPGVNADEKTNIRTQYAYDANGNRTSIQDGKGNTTSFHYDALNRKIAEADAIGNTTEYRFDEVGNVSSVRNPNQQTINYSYTSRGEVSAIQYPDSTVSFTYDGLGQKTKMVDQSGETVWSYSDNELVTSITSAGGSVRYEYDPAGNRTKLIYPDDKSASYTYTNNNQIDTVTAGWQGTSIRYSYDEIGRLIQSSLPNGIQSSYTYDGAGRLTQLSSQSPDRVWANYQYVYDNAGNRTKATEVLVIPPTLPFVAVDVKDSVGTPLVGLQVYAFTGEVYSGFSAVTGDDGIARFTLPEGDYRFRADKKGFRYWSSEQNNCTILGCEKTSITIPSFGDVTITVSDSSGTPLQGLPIYTFEGAAYNGVNGISDENGKLTLSLPQGKYRFRTDKNSLQFFSGDEGHCEVPTCTEAKISVPQFSTVAVSVANTTQAIEGGIQVYAFDGEKYTGANAVTDETGKANFLLPEGNYHFRADKNNLQFWSNKENNCTVVGCEAASITVPVFGDVALTVKDSQGNPEANLSVYAFNGEDYTGHQGVTTETGQVTLTLPEGNYRFRADKFGHQYFSQVENHCAVPECKDGAIQVPRFGEVKITITDSVESPQVNQPVYVFDGETYTGINGQTDENGQTSLKLPEGTYRFRSDINGRQYWSNPENQCSVPQCTEASIKVPQSGTVTVHVANAFGTVWPDIVVSAYDGLTNSGINGKTDVNGDVSFSLPEGSYRFRADMGGNQVFSAEKNHCTVPACTHVDFTANNPAEISQIKIHLVDTTGQPASSLTVEAYHNPPYFSENKTTDVNGDVSFSLVYGDYAFFLYIGNEHIGTTHASCTQPDCGVIEYEVPQTGSIVVTVVNGNNVPKSGYYVNPQNSDGVTYSGQKTDENGQVSFVLREGNYRFSVGYYPNEQYGQKIWSGETFDCAIPGCETTSIVFPQSHLVQVTVVDGSGVPQSNIPVYANNSNGNVIANSTTDGNGQVALDLPEGNYRFSARPYQYDIWSGETYHCVVPGCETATITLPQVFSVNGTVIDMNGNPPEWAYITAYDSNGWESEIAGSDENGQFQFMLPEGNYRFFVHFGDGSEVWSGDTFHCSVPGCDNVSISHPRPGVTETAPIPTETEPAPTDEPPAPTDEPLAPTDEPPAPTEQASKMGGVVLARYTSLKSYADPAVSLNSADSSVEIVVTDSTGAPQVGLHVYAFNDATYTGQNGTTDDNGKAVISLPAGSFRFRVDKFNSQYWSGASNHCTTPDCTTAAVTVPVFGLVTASVKDTAGAPATGLPVYAFNETTYTGFNGTTNEAGQAIFNLPEGIYRFRTDKNNQQYWSGESNHCSVPQCTDANLTVPVFGAVAVTVHDTTGKPEASLPVYAFNETTYTGFNGTTDAIGQVNFNLPEGSYRFRSDKNGQQYFSGETNHCTITSCESAEVTVPVFGTVTVHVATSGGSVQADVPVYAFNETTYTGFSAKTDTNGDAAFNIPEGNYRFRGDKNNVQYWSSETNNCAIPGCTTAAVTIPVFGTVTVSVKDTADAGQADLPVYVFNDANYTGFNAKTDAQGQAVITLPEGNYRLRVDKNNLQYWSGETNHCSVPTCTTAEVSLPLFENVAVTVADSTNAPQAEIPVYVFDATTYKGFTAKTDTAGLASFTLPAGNYRFRADVHGHQYWSGAENHCTAPGCTTAQIAVPRFGQVTVTTQYRDGEILTDLPVYAFSGETYSGISGTSDKEGKVQLWLPEANYHFRADQNKLAFWSGPQDHCAVPGCEAVTISTYATGNNPTRQNVINYTYDGLNRLTAADYESGTYYHYTYDAVGNRLNETRKPNSTLPEVVNTYDYDNANRLMKVNEANYSWDANGNLLNDGTNTYTYDSANRLTHLVNPKDDISYAYNGLGDRISKTSAGKTENGTWSRTANYKLDMNAGLTQVLNDGTSTYLYGVGRISQENDDGVNYFLGDALGSVRQLASGTAPDAKVMLTREYSPYGEIVSQSGTGKTEYGFTGELQDGGLVHLRARDYLSDIGRFFQVDIIEQSLFFPQAQNNYSYTQDNPVNYLDPTGHIRWHFSSDPLYHQQIEDEYGHRGFGIAWFNPNKQLEYRIPGFGLTIDMFNSFTGDVFEIEPVGNLQEGYEQVINYADKLNYAAENNNLPFTWNNTFFHSGTPEGWGGEFRKSPLSWAFPFVDLVADYDSGGVVEYWIELNATAPILIEALDRKAKIVPNKRILRKRGFSLQPAYAMDNSVIEDGNAMILDVNDCRNFLIIQTPYQLAQIYKMTKNPMDIGIPDDIVINSDNKDGYFINNKSLLVYPILEIETLLLSFAF